jgi:hypothetical protein
MRILMLGIMLLAAPMAFAAFTLQDDGSALTVQENGKPVLVYHYALVTPPDGVAAHYRRACYIHPLYGLDGEVMTEDFPKDHYHHRGVFWAWPLCTVGSKPMDVWALDKVRQVHEKWVTRDADDQHAEIAAENGWVFDDAPDQPQVREHIRFTVHPEADNARALDFELRFENLSKETVTFLGAKNKGYGGFCLRPDSKRKPFQFTSALGTHPEDVLRAQTPWADISYRTKPDGPYSGAAVFQHPSDPGYPHLGWIMRHYGFLGVSWPHEETYILKSGDSFTLRYRMVLHRGTANDAGIAARFKAYEAQEKTPK